MAEEHGLVWTHTGGDFAVSGWGTERREKQGQHRLPKGALGDLIPTMSHILMVLPLSPHQKLRTKPSTHNLWDIAAWETASQQWQSGNLQWLHFQILRNTHSSFHDGHSEVPPCCLCRRLPLILYTLPSSTLKHSYFFKKSFLLSYLFHIFNSLRVHTHLCIYLFIYCSNCSSRTQAGLIIAKQVLHLQATSPHLFNYTEGS